MDLTLPPSQPKSTYQLAYDFVVNVVVPKLPSHKISDPHTGAQLTFTQLVDGYRFNTWGTRPTTLNDIYKSLIETAQNMQGMPKTIQALLNSSQTLAGVPQFILHNPNNYIGKLFAILKGFDPQAVFTRYPYNTRGFSGLDAAAERLMNDIMAQLNPNYAPRLTQRSQCPKFCKSIITGAGFLSRFSTGNNPATLFNQFVQQQSQSLMDRVALADHIEQQVHNFGFALACNFLKDLGFLEFAKPDTHLIRMMSCTRLSQVSPNQKTYNRQQKVQVFMDVDTVAQRHNVTPFDVDKVFWLIGSGNFHFHNEKVGDHTQDFLRQLRARQYTLHPNC